MDFIDSLLNNEIINICFENCKKANVYRSNHDKRHAVSCLKIADEILPLFDVGERESLIIKTCLIFHDIGQNIGRKGHEERSARFAVDFLRPYNVFDDGELSEIYSAILTHDEYRDFSKLKHDSSWFVNLIDKLDISRSRQVDDAAKKFVYTDFADIDHLEFSLDGGVFTVVIKTIDNPKVIDKDNIFNQNVFSKMMQVLKNFCKHFGLIAKVKIEDEELDFNKINVNVMVN